MRQLPEYCVESRDFIRISGFRHSHRPLVPIQQARFPPLGRQPPGLSRRGGPELAFAGRSNVGKSSAINALRGRKRLAFFSKTPGRTQTINFFDLGDGPGWPTCRVRLCAASRSPARELGRPDRRLSDGRRNLGAVVVLMDARRPLTANDRQFLEWLRPVRRSRLVLLSKADKLTRASAENAAAPRARSTRPHARPRSCCFPARAAKA
jgi:GTP-binding protein